MAKAMCVENPFQFRVRWALQLVAFCACAWRPSSVVAVEPERYTLQNGLEVILQPDVHAGQIGVAVTYHVGQRDDPPGYEGLAHLVEHMTYRGSRHQPDSLITPLLEAGINEYNGFVSSDQTTYFEVVPAQQLPLALWVESERMAFSLERFDEHALELERDIVVRERDQSQARDGRYPQFVAEALYPIGHPYRSLHRMANSEGSLELDHARWFFQRWYYPGNATLTLTGGFEPGRARALIEQYFGSVVNPKGVTPHAPADAIVFEGQETIELETPAKRSQLQMIWAIPCVKQSCNAALELDFIEELLAGNSEALMTRELVQKHAVASRVGMTVDRRDRHLEVQLSIGLAIGVTHERALAVVDALLSRWQGRGVPADGLAPARLRMMTRDAQRPERPVAMLFPAMRMSSRFGDFESAEQRAARLVALGPKDVQRALRSYLPLGRRLIIAVHADNGAPYEAELRERTGALRSRGVRP